MGEADDGLHRVIEVLSETDLSSYLPRIRDDLQITKLSHFEYVQSNDLERIGLSKPAIRRLFAAVKRKQRPNTKKTTNTLPASPPLTSSCLISASSLQLSSTLGTGHYGIVRQGTWNGMPVAVKVLHGCNAVGDFVREANAMHSLSHQYLIRLYGIVLSEPLMMVTELAPLGSLLSRLRSEPKHFLVHMLVEYVRQISEAMNYLEQRRFVHRDLAARNIFLVSYEQIKIGDFGLARMIDSDCNLYKTGTVKSQSIPIAWCAPESLRRQEFSSSTDVWMFAVTVWEIFSLGAENPWPGCSVQEILDALEQRGERLRCPDACPPSIYSLLLLCWSLNPNDRPKFNEIRCRINQYRPAQYRVIRDNKQVNQLTILQGDTVSVFDSHPDKAMWRGQNHRTLKVGFFPRACLSSAATAANEKISWPVKGSFIHTGHSDGTGQGPSWGRVDKIDETILNNPIVTPTETNQKAQGVQIVSSVLHLHESDRERPIVTRPPPPVPKNSPSMRKSSSPPAKTAPSIPKSPPTIRDDLLLIDFNQLPSSNDPQRPTPGTASVQHTSCHQSSKLEHCRPLPSPVTQRKFTGNSTDSHRFVEMVVTGVTEQLKHDFPRRSSTKADFTPPVVRKFTIPYPPNQGSYYNLQRQE